MTLSHHRIISVCLVVGKLFRTHIDTTSPTYADIDVRMQQAQPARQYKTPCFSADSNIKILAFGACEQSANPIAPPLPN